MLLGNDDGTSTAGPADIVYILRLPGGRFHVVFAEEHPMPGPIQPIDALDILRLKSKMHHTSGADDFAMAQTHLDELLTQIRVRPENVVRDAAFDAEDPVSSFVLPNWTRGSVSLRQSIASVFAEVSDEFDTPGVAHV